MLFARSISVTPPTRRKRLFFRNTSRRPRREARERAATGPETSLCYRNTSSDRPRRPGHEPDDPERRQRDLGRLRLPVPGGLLGLDPEPVADVAAAVEARVRVQRLVPLAGLRQPDPPALAHDRREVAGDHDPAFPVLAPPCERKHVLVRRIRLQPEEPLVRVVDLPERGLLGVGGVEV